MNKEEDKGFMDKDKMTSLVDAAKAQYDWIK